MENHQDECRVIDSSEEIQSSEKNLLEMRSKFHYAIELILSMLFGIGAWLTVNGVFVELPLLATVAPEGWALPSHLSLAVQAANAGPILYMLMLRYWPRARRFSSRAVAVCVVLLVGASACVALAFTWDRAVAGKSWPIIILTFFFALVGCTSSVLFIPFVAAFGPRSLAAYFTGEGVGGLVPGVMALVQGVGSCDHGALFSPSVYFCGLFILMLCSFLGFVLLYKRQPRVSQGKKAEEIIHPLGRRQLAFLLLISCWVCLLANGLLPGIQSYSCAPYGNAAYHLAATLGAMANPVTCLVAFFTPLRNSFSLSRSSPLKLCLCLGVATLGSTALSMGAITTAVLSPRPPLVGTATGEVLIVLIWIGLTVGAVYAKVGAAGAIQDSIQCGNTGRGPLLWYGAFTQGGSAVGSLVAFLAVTEWNLFIAHSPC